MGNWNKATIIYYKKWIESGSASPFDFHKKKILFISEIINHTSTLRSKLEINMSQNMRTDWHSELKKKLFHSKTQFLIRFRIRSDEIDRIRIQPHRTNRIRIHDFNRIHDFSRPNPDHTPLSWKFFIYLMMI